MGTPWPLPLSNPLALVLHGLSNVVSIDSHGLQNLSWLKLKPIILQHWPYMVLHWQSMPFCQTIGLFLTLDTLIDTPWSSWHSCLGPLGHDVSNSKLAAIAPLVSPYDLSMPYYAARALPDTSMSKNSIVVLNTLQPSTRFPLSKKTRHLQSLDAPTCSSWCYFKAQNLSRLLPTIDDNHIEVQTFWKPHTKPIAYMS